MAENNSDQEKIILKDQDFIPGSDFNAQFENVQIEGEGEDDFQEDNTNEGGDDDQQNQNNGDDENQQQQESEEEKFKAANGGKTKAEVEADKKASDELAAKAKIEEEKLAKMTPEEREKHLAKNNSGDNNNNNAPKPFEEELVARFNGKYKTVAEIEAALNTPPPVQEFADETVKNLNEYVKAGGKIDAEYLQEITTDYDGIEDGVELAMRHLKATDPKFKNASAAELEFEVRRTYLMDEWSEDGAEDMNEVRKIMSMRLERECEETFRPALKERQAKLQFIKQVDPKVAEAKSQERAENLKTWKEKIVPGLVQELSKLSTPLTDKEAFEYANDANDTNEVVQVLNSMGEDAKGFWAQFTDKEGKFDHKKVARMLLRDRGYDKAIKLAREQGRAVGREEEVKNIKNIDFNTDNKRNSGQGGDQSFDQAVYESVSKNV